MNSASAFDNFLITAMGRSGTKFLSSVMNRSPTWTVRHEPRPRHDVRSLEGFSGRARFNRHRYGEVNSRLRWVLMDIPVRRRGVIIRHPSSLWLSIYNKRASQGRASDGQHYENILRAYGDALSMLDRYVRMGATLIRFERMTRDLNYLRRVLDSFGIHDVELSQDIMLRKVNKPKRYPAPSYDLLPTRWQRDGLSLGEEFIERYYGEAGNANAPYAVA